MTPRTRLLLISAALILSCAVPGLTSLHAQQLLFFDDFSEPEPDGRPSSAVWAVYSGGGAEQFAVVTDENSADYFGAAGQNYLHFKKPGTGTSLSLVATNGFSEAANVITVDFRFFELPVAGEAPTHTDPRFRFGINNPVSSNNNRTPHDNRFQYGTFSGEDGLYSVGEAVDIRIVYNNSLDAISYTAGPDLASSSYDVWVNGTRTLVSHTYGTVTGIGVGTAMTSIGIAGFSANTTDFLVNSVSVYSGAIPEPSTYALSIGFLAFIFVIYHSRRSRQRIAQSATGRRSS